MPTPKGGLIPGVTVLIGGVEYTAPQLNFGALRRMKEIKITPTYADDLMAFVLVESLKRNYGDVDHLWLNETLEGTETIAAGQAILEIMKASGLKAQDQSQGEAQAVTG